MLIELLASLEFLSDYGQLMLASEIELQCDETAHQKILPKFKVTFDCRLRESLQPEKTQEVSSWYHVLSLWLPWLVAKTVLSQPCPKEALEDT